LPARCGCLPEVLGPKLKHLDLNAGTITIEQRVWHGDVDEPKSQSSHRTLALGHLIEQCGAWVKVKKITHQDAWIFAQEDNPEQPMWDSGVRKALHAAARAVGCDFPGPRPHSFRRANITWRQQVGGSAIEASNITGHADLEMTGE
jgi:integrase